MGCERPAQLEHSWPLPAGPGAVLEMESPGSPGGWCSCGRSHSHPRTFWDSSPSWEAAHPLWGQPTFPTESLNCFGWRNPLRSSKPTTNPCPQVPHPHTFNTSRDGDCTTSLTNLSVKKLPQTANLYLCWHNSRLFPLILSLVQIQGSSACSQGKEWPSVAKDYVKTPPSRVR